MKKLLLSPFRLLKERYFGEETRNPRVARTALAKLSERLPANVIPIATTAVESLIEYQDPDYALLYLDRLARYVGPGGISSPLLENLASLLLARMQFEDAINIARQKIVEIGGMNSQPNPSSIDRIELFRWDEIIAMLPPAAADPAMMIFARLRLAKLSQRLVRLHFSATTRFRLLRLKGMAALRITRPFSQRFKTERSWVERWLHMVDRSVAKHPEAVADVIKTAELIKEHGDTYQDGIAKWNVIVDELVKPTCDGALPLRQLSDAIKEAHLAALKGAGEVRQTVNGLRGQCLGAA